LNDWLAANHATGWLFTIVGAVLILSAMFAPVFAVSSTKRHMHSVEPVA
jgi:hypothetical protein